MIPFSSLSLTGKHIALLCNPLAGVGKATHLTNLLKTALQEQKVDFSIFNKEWPADFTGYNEIWIVGGDGTLNYFVNHYPGIKLPLVIFKGGTGNDFHWLLYGNLNWKDQLQLVLQEQPKPIDLVKCNDRYFLNGAGIGFEGEVARSLTGKNKLPGKTSFYITILRKIFFYRSKLYTVTVNGEAFSGNKLMVSITNGSRAGGGFHISPEARADDGLLDLVMVNELSPLKRIRYLPVIEKGKHLDLPFITHILTEKVQVEGDAPMHLHLDGEYFSARKIDVEILKGELRFIY